jgi:hypothetical protein
MECSIIARLLVGRMKASRQMLAGVDAEHTCMYVSCNLAVRDCETGIPPELAEPRISGIPAFR